MYISEYKKIPKDYYFFFLLKKPLLLRQATPPSFQRRDGGRRMESSFALEEAFNTIEISDRLGKEKGGFA